MASVKANPKIATLNKSSFKFGFLEIPNINEPNITPIPRPAPVSPKVASPAPIFCAACNNIKSFRENYIVLNLGPIGFEPILLPL